MTPWLVGVAMSKRATGKGTVYRPGDGRWI
jgi:hypothetical protein